MLPDYRALVRYCTGEDIANLLLTPAFSLYSRTMIGWYKIEKIRGVHVLTEPVDASCPSGGGLIAMAIFWMLLRLVALC